MHNSDAVADAFRPQDFNGLAHGFGPADFARMHQAVQALFRSIVIHAAKILHGKREFVAAHSKGNYAFRFHLRRQASNLHGRIGAKLADSVEDPLESQAFFVRVAAGCADGGKIGGGVLLAPEHDADGERHLGIRDVLSEQSLSQALGDEPVVGRSAEERRHPPEGLEKTVEVPVVVSRLDFLSRHGLVVAGGQLHHCRRLDSAFQM